MIFNDVSDMKKRYKLFAENWLNKITDKYGTVGMDIKLKVNHGLSMCDAVKKTTVSSGFFNESYEVSGAIDGLLHDVGRFPQYYLSGTLKDDKSEMYTHFKDHGQYGAYLLGDKNNSLLHYFIGEDKRYDDIIKEVVKEHTTIRNHNYQLDINDLVDIFPNYNLDEILKSNNQELKNKLIALKLLLLREEDCLEILHKVRDGLWKPAISSEKHDYIKKEPWETFINFDYVNMSDLKSRGLWSCNVGYLLRYSLLLRNISFVGTLKTIVDDDMINQIYLNQRNNVTNDQNELMLDERYVDPLLKEAKDYTIKAVKNLILTSLDGKIITKKSREKAKQKTLKEYGGLI